MKTVLFYTIQRRFRENRLWNVASIYKNTTAPKQRRFCDDRL